MSAPHRTIQDAEIRNDPETQPSAPAAAESARTAEPPFDWQVLLLRYLPQPVGSSHVIKRLAPR